MKDMTPARIVAYLDQYIIGQKEAKRSVAIALRNRFRAGRLPADVREEITPKNILLIGPTGVGKTEMARRLAHLLESPFVKVEATKYTEVGYVGRDVESMVRDLVEEAVHLIKRKEATHLHEKAEEEAVEKIGQILHPMKKEENRSPMDIIFGEKKEEAESSPVEREQHKALLEKIRRGELDDREIEVEVEEKNKNQAVGDNEQANQISQMFSAMMPKKMKKKKMTVRMAKKVLAEAAADELIDMDVVCDKAIAAAEEKGIIFIDEIDKVAGRQSVGGGADVSREGVQRDILPIVEGATVKTKYGPVKTDHILFMAAGAFHVAKPGDLIPELQGRFPIRVELQSLTKEDLRRILTEPRQALIRQYTELLKVEGVTLTFTDDALEAMADIATAVNRDTEDIGARRLYTILEQVLSDVSFDAPDLEDKNVVIHGDYVRQKLGKVKDNMDISNYIL